MTFNNLDELRDYFERTAGDGNEQHAFRDAHNTISIITPDDDGELFYTQVPTDDPELKPIDFITTDNLRWPLTRLVPEPEPLDDEPCGASMWSWSYFRTEQVDPYWMRCHQLGEHDQHENSETGATWPNLTNTATALAAGTANFERI